MEIPRWLVIAMLTTSMLSVLAAAGGWPGRLCVRVAKRQEGFSGEMTDLLRLRSPDAKPSRPPMYDHIGCMMDRQDSRTGWDEDFLDRNSGSDDCDEEIKEYVK